MEQLKLYKIDMKYVRNLHNADDRVESVLLKSEKSTEFS